MGAVVLMFFIGVGAVMGLYLAVTKLPGMLAQRKLETRLQELSAPLDEPKEGDKLLVKAQREGPLPAIDRLLAGTTRGSALGRWIDQSGMKATISGILLIGVVCAVLMALVAGMITRAPWGLPLGAMLGFSLPFIVYPYTAMNFRGMSLHVDVNPYEIVDLVLGLFTIDISGDDGQGEPEEAVPGR